MTRLIDADELVPMMKYATTDSEIGVFPIKIGFKEITKVIDESPTVDAQPVRHGRFIGTEYDGYADGNPVYYEWKCSECGCVFEDEEPTYNYCPNCGAKMDGDEHGSD